MAELRRLEFHCTSKHANWLNTVEIEIGVMHGQCPDHRIDNPDWLRREIDAWEYRRIPQRGAIRAHHRRGPERDVTITRESPNYPGGVRCSRTIASVVGGAVVVTGIGRQGAARQRIPEIALVGGRKVRSRDR